MLKTCILVCAMVLFGTANGLMIKDTTIVKGKIMTRIEA